MVSRSLNLSPRTLSCGSNLSDVKPDNILANRGTQGSSRFKDIKLSDLGDSTVQNVSQSSRRFATGTAVYRAPEVILKAPLTTSLDIWALGATVGRPLIEETVQC